MGGQLPVSLKQKRLRSTNPCCFSTRHLAREAICVRESELRTTKTLSNRHLQKGEALLRIGAKYIHDHKTYPKCNSNILFGNLKDARTGKHAQYPSESNPDR